MDNKKTIEEAANRLFPNAEQIGGETYTAYKGFIEGAKWQAERMYSEEEVMDLFKKYQYDLAQWVLRMEDDISGKPIPTEWFNQFKKQNNEK